MRSILFYLGGIVALVLCSLLYLTDLELKEKLELVQSGQKSLYCQFSYEGYNKIDPNLVIDIEEIDGRIYWKFTNGQATQCYVE